MKLIMISEKLELLNHDDSNVVLLLYGVFVLFWSSDLFGNVMLMSMLMYYIYIF